MIINFYELKSFYFYIPIRFTILYRTSIKTFTHLRFLIHWKLSMIIVFLSIEVRRSCRSNKNPWYLLATWLMCDNVDETLVQINLINLGVYLIVIHLFVGIEVKKMKFLIYSLYKSYQKDVHLIVELFIFKRFSYKIKAWSLSFTGSILSFNLPSS